MANARNPKRKGHDTSRDQGGFVALPWTVLDCPAYGRLSHPAKALLLEVARQFVRDNNGRMLLSRAYMATRGWKSMDTLTKCKAELLNAGFIFQTVMGHRPNKASWFAVTWRALDKLPGYDAGTDQLFKRGAYQQNMPPKIRVLIPPGGTERPAIVPPGGTETLPTVPPGGTIKALLGTPPVPPHGHHLEMPSVAVCIEDVLCAVQQGTPHADCDGDQPGNSATQQNSTSGTSATLPTVSSTLEVPPTECELVYAADDAGEDF